MIAANIADLSTPAAVASSATGERFRERRDEIVDAGWHLTFIFCFALSGILGTPLLAVTITTTPAWAMIRYLGIMCLSGLAGGVVGAAAGHGVAALWDRWDIRHHPRRYETPGADSALDR